MVGLRTYYDTCVSPSAIRLAGVGRPVEKQALGNGKELEVEHSEVVPIKQAQNGDPLLDLPAAPTGLACAVPKTVPRMRGSGGAPPAPPWANPTLTLQNVDRVTQSDGRTATADYVGDQWQFGGSLDLSNAPWAMQSQQSVSNQPGYPLETESVQNVFVDWGDGTIEPLTIEWHGQYCGGSPCFASNTETSSAQVFDLGSATNPKAFGHPYGETGEFNVRVYMLPAAAVQQQGAQPISLHAGSGGLYGKLLARAGQMPSGPSSSDDLAYMLFCQTVHIQHRTDPVSNGPLQLSAIRVTGFPGDEAGGLHGVIRKLARESTAAATPPTTPAASPVHVVPKFGGAAGGGQPALPQFSSCDVSLVGGASLDFQGQGTVRLTWYQDGKAVGTSDEAIGPSTSRTDAQLAPPHPHEPITSTWTGLHSPALPLAAGQIGKHDLRVAAEVVQDAHPIARALGELGRYAGAPTARAPASAALGGAPPLGVLGPRAAASAGLPPIQWVNQAPAGAPGMSLHAGIGDRSPVQLVKPGGVPPDDVVSAPAGYEVTAADPSLPCTFSFPVKGGKFVVAGLQHGGKATVTQQSEATPARRRCRLCSPTRVARARSRSRCRSTSRAGRCRATA